MTKRKKKGSKARSRSPQPAEPAETRASDAMTVAWTVSLMTVMLCDLALILLRVAASRADLSDRLKLLSDLLLFVSVVSGVLSLVLLPIVCRVRRRLPPKGLMVFGVCVAIAPLLMVAVRLLK